MRTTDKITHDGKTLTEILRLHKLWLDGDKDGRRASLCEADLREANLCEADLREANLRWANMYGANLSGASLCRADLYGANLCRSDLREADLSRADLCRANLYDADLSGADLREANLRWANMYGANLSGASLCRADLREASLCEADLREANLCEADLREANLRWANMYGANLSGAKNIPEIAKAQTLITPDGDIIGWKKCRDGVIVKLLVPASVPRHNATGRKCRAESAIVLEVIGAEYGVSQHDGKTEYRVGQCVTCDKWDEDRFNECAGGIHFFITRAEAEAY